VSNPTFSLDFQEDETEFAGLPGKCAGPEGRHLLARHGDTVLGCAALRRVDASTCEMKRVYVRPFARVHRSPETLRVIGLCAVGAGELQPRPWHPVSCACPVAHTPRQRVLVDLAVDGSLSLPNVNQFGQHLWLSVQSC